MFGNLYIGTKQLPNPIAREWGSCSSTRVCAGHMTQLWSEMVLHDPKSVPASWAKLSAKVASD
jgi:hypothetical protein